MRANTPDLSRYPGDVLHLHFIYLAGEEISENYGLMYTIKSRESRRRVLLSHYKFSCSCVACVENWPTLQQMKAEVKEQEECCRRE